MADLIRNKNDSTALHAAAQEVLASCEPPPPGPQTAGIGAASRTKRREPFPRHGVSRVSLGERDTRLAFTVLEGAIRRLSAAPGERVLVFVSSGFFLTDELRQEETEIMDRAIRANVRISSLNARGLYALVPGGDASTPTTAGGPDVMRIKDQYQRESALAEEDIMAELADATGGRYFHNNNDLKVGLKPGGRGAGIRVCSGILAAKLEAGWRLSPAQSEAGQFARARICRRGADITPPSIWPIRKKTPSGKSRKPCFRATKCRIFPSICICNSLNRATSRPRSPCWRA